jgi:hypothetical protein
MHQDVVAIFAVQQLAAVQVLRGAGDAVGNTPTTVAVTKVVPSAYVAQLAKLGGPARVVKCG